MRSRPCDISEGIYRVLYPGKRLFPAKSYQTLPPIKLATCPKDCCPEISKRKIFFLLKMLSNTLCFKNKPIPPGYKMALLVIVELLQLTMAELPFHVCCTMHLCPHMCNLWYRECIDNADSMYISLRFLEDPYLAPSQS